MASYADAASIADQLPGVSRGVSFGNPTWVVGKQFFIWERPFSKADIKRFGDDPVPSGPILGAKVADLADKTAVLAEGHVGVFTIPHFDNFAAVLIQLDIIDGQVLRDLIVDAWLTVAPPAVAAAYLREHPIG